jgi:hypothetical protein
VAIHLSLGKQKAQRRPGVSKPLEGGDASQKSRKELMRRRSEGRNASMRTSHYRYLRFSSRRGSENCIMLGLSSCASMALSLSHVSVYMAISTKSKLLLERGINLFTAQEYGDGENRGAIG